METAKETTKTCTNPVCRKNFRIVAQEHDFYERKALPEPDHCPACRHRARMALRSERALYRRTCIYCQKDCLSTIPETAPYKIACHTCFWENIQ